MSTIDLLGAFEGDFNFKSLDVYVGLTAGLRYMGKTKPEKTIKYPQEIIEFKDGMPQVTYIMDYKSVGIEVDFSFMQVWDLNQQALIMDSDLDTSSTAAHYNFFGSNPAAKSKREWRFVGASRDGRLGVLVIRKGMVKTVGDTQFGTGDYTSWNVTVTATPDPAITDEKRNLGYFMIIPRTFS